MQKTGKTERMLKNMAVSLLLVIACSCFHATVLGQEIVPQGLGTYGSLPIIDPQSAAPQDVPRWTLNFQSAPWPLVLKELSSNLGFSLSMTTEPEGTFSFHDSREYNATEVIDIVNDQLLPLGFLVIRNQQRLAVVKTDQPISDSLIPFVSLSEIDLIGRNEFAGTAIPIKGSDPLLTVSEIELIKSPIGKVRSFANSQRIVVMDTGTHLRRIRDLLLRTGFARSDTISAVYQLKHAKAEDVSKAIEEFLNSQSGSSEFASPISLESDRVVAEKTTNSLLVRGSQESLPVLFRIIADLDRSPREVLLQALIVEVLVSNTREFGVEAGLQDSVLFDRSIVNSIQTVTQTSTAPNGVQTTDQSILSRQVSPGFQFNGANLGTNAVNPNRIGSQGLANFGVGRVNNELGFGGLVLSAGSDSVSVLLRALDAKFNVDVLSRPQVRTVENKEAFIQVGQQVPVVDGVVVNAVGSANPVVRQDKAGIILKATPRISPDGRVQIDVNTEKSAFILTRGSGVPIFTDATTGRVIEAPVKDITTASTTVSVQSGETVVLGGMITNSESVVHRKVPWLGDIPLLGRLFRYDSNQFARKELIVFLTPVLLNDDANCFHMNQELSTMKVTPATNEMLERWNQFRGFMSPVLGLDQTQATEPQEVVLEEAAAQDAPVEEVTTLPSFEIVTPPPSVQEETAP